MKNNDRLLIVEDDLNLSSVLKDELHRRGMDVTTTNSGEEAQSILQEDFEVMLLDLNLPGMSGLDLLKRIIVEPNAPEVVVLTGNIEVDSAVQAMKSGAYDYLQKPVPMDRLYLVLNKAAEKCRLRLDNRRLRRQITIDQVVPEDIVVISPKNIEVFQLAEKSAQSDVSVLIMGETGTGKDVVARYIHDRSPRSKGPYISINCAAFQETTLENELFGHEKGAFTDAKERKLGFFELASSGTIFLDEIADMSMGMQSKLLHVLEKGSFYRVGGTREINTDTRIIAATNKILQDNIREGTFRQDLFYRINMLTIEIPPLRERREEIIPLAERFLSENNSGKVLSQEVSAVLISYSWPGNIRELRHIIRRADLITTGNEIQPDGLGLVSQDSEDTHSAQEPVSLEEMESLHITRVLESVSWKRSLAAKILKIDPKTLYRKIKKYKIDT